MGVGCCAWGRLPGGWPGLRQGGMPTLGGWGAWEDEGWVQWEAELGGGEAQAADSPEAGRGPGELGDPAWALSWEKELGLAKVLLVARPRSAGGGHDGEGTTGTTPQPGSTQHSAEALQGRGLETCVELDKTLKGTCILSSSQGKGSRMGTRAGLGTDWGTSGADTMGENPDDSTCQRKAERRVC